MILVEKIVELVAVPRAILCENAQPGELAVALQPLPAHDERTHDRLAYARQFRERLAKPICGHFQDFALISFASPAGQRRGSHERRHVPHETAGPKSRGFALARRATRKPPARRAALPSTRDHA